MLFNVGNLILHCKGISIDPRTFSGFMASLTSSPGFRTISFSEFRDFLLFMPRTASVDEIYRYYELRKILDDDSHGPALVNMGGSLSGSLPKSTCSPYSQET